METVRRWIAQVQAQLSGLTVSQKMLIGTLTIIMAMSLAMVMLYAARPDMVELPLQSASAEQISQVGATLDARGVRYEMVGNTVRVAVDDRHRAMSAITQDQLLPRDTSSGFRSIIEQQTWWHGNKQQDQMWDVALQDELGRVLREWPGVRFGTVIISRAAKQGFGATHKRPTASVNIVMSDGKVDQRMADAIAALVSGAVAEMEPRDVAVIDAVAKRQWKVGDEESVGAGDFLEQVRQLERYYQSKVADSLRFIPGVIVSVNVELDPSRRERESVNYDETKSYTPLATERRESSNTTDRQSVGEAGAGPNVKLDIFAGGNSGRESTTEESESTFDPHVGMTKERVVEATGVPERISATVHVPRTYLVTRYKQANNDDSAEPLDTELQAFADLAFKDKIMPLLAAKSAPNVVVGIYTQLASTDQADPLRGGTAAGMLTGGYLKYAGLGALALVSVTMMLMMVRKAHREPKLPDVRELAGLPPKIPEDDVVIGDATEAELTLTGVELSGGELRSRQLTEQLAGMIQAQPDEVARLLGRWIEKVD